MDRLTHRSMPSPSTCQETAVIGAGICGRMIALRLAMSGHRVTLFESNSFADRSHCSGTAAGMLAPFTESVYGEPGLVELGAASLALWRDFGQNLFHEDHEERPMSWRTCPSNFRERHQTHGISFLGSLVLAHEQNLDELREYRLRLNQKIPNSHFSELLQQDVSDLEPSLGQNFSRGIYFPTEAHLNTWSVLDQLMESLQTAGVILRDHSKVIDMKPYQVTFKDREDFTKTHACDMVFDCRGIGAKQDISHLRGVRGETLIIKMHQAYPSESLFEIKRPVRILHPRYPIYIVPRTHDTFVVGATMIESESTEPITVNSALELLTALYHCHESFKHASILGSMSSVRPALYHHRPEIIPQPGLMRINGLYRHGFLLAPVVAKTAIDLFQLHKIDSIQQVLLSETSSQKEPSHDNI